MSELVPDCALAAAPALTKSESDVRFHELSAIDDPAFVERVNGWFRWLLPLQWIVVLAFASLQPLGVAPRVYLVAIVAGGLLTFSALGLLRVWPKDIRALCGLAVAQVGFSALLIFLNRGPAGLEGHLLVSMVVLSVYRDWRVLLTATGAAAIFGVAVALSLAATSRVVPGTISSLAALGGWILIENAALVWWCVKSRRDRIEISERRRENQHLLDAMDRRIRERTEHLEKEMALRERTARELLQKVQKHRELVASVPIGIFETTRSGRVNFANPYLLGLIGLPSTFDPTAVTLADGRIFPLAARARLWERLDAEQEVRGFSATLHHYDGTPFEVVINARLKAGAPDAEPTCEGTLEDVTVRKRAEHDLEILHGQLLVASRQAGMAEVATGVLHNVGNVLTSVNLIIHDVQDRLKTTRLSHLHRVVEILQREQARLAEFLTTDSNGRQVPEFLAKLDAHLTNENAQLLSDVEGLVRHFEHIREIIITQQNSAQLFGVLETLEPAQLFEDALRLVAESLQRHGITLERQFATVGLVKADRHKVLQILVNLLKNAKDALDSRKPGDRLVRVHVSAGADHTVNLAVQDNGQGIISPNLTRIFQHGYTTKPNGHGYGLHSSVLAAREMGGDLSAASEGPGLGSTFTLNLPVAR